MGAVGFWAGRQVITPAPTAEQPQAATATYTAQGGSLSRELSFTGQLTWPTAVTATSPGDGVLTAVELGEVGLIEPGDALYRVDEIAVIACPGEVPAFRDLDVGMSGRDVAQLRACLNVPAADEFDDVLQQAVSGSLLTGGDTAEPLVQLGRVVFIAGLPARGYLAEGMIPGVRLSAGQPVVTTVSAAPDITLTVNSAAPVVPTEGMSVSGDVNGTPFLGVIGPASTSPNGETTVTVLSPEGTAACTEECAVAAPVPGPIDVSLLLEVVPEAAGTLVPVSAVRTSPDGSAEVTTVDGAVLPVTVLVTANGQAVVEGLGPGTEIMLFAPAP